MPPPYTLEYILSDDASFESSVELDFGVESVIEQSVTSDEVGENQYYLNNESLSDEDLIEKEKEKEIRVVSKSSNELESVIFAGENKITPPPYSELFQSDFQDENFQQEEYDLNEISLEDLDSHYAGITASSSEVHVPFLEEAHSSIFPPQSKDLFLGQNENKEELEYQFIDWEAFVEYCISHDFPEEYMPYIRLSSAKINGDECILRISSSTALHQLNVVQKEVEKFLVNFLGRAVNIRYAADVYERRTLAEMMESMHEHPQIKMLEKEFGANLLRCSCLKTELKEK